MCLPTIKNRSLWEWSKDVAVISVEPISLVDRGTSANETDREKESSERFQFQNRTSLMTDKIFLVTKTDRQDGPRE